MFYFFLGFNCVVCSQLSHWFFSRDQTFTPTHKSTFMKRNRVKKSQTFKMTNFSSHATPRYSSKTRKHQPTSIHLLSISTRFLIGFKYFLFSLIRFQFAAYFLMFFFSFLSLSSGDPEERKHFRVN